MRASSFTDCVFYSNDTGKAIPTGSLFSGDKSLVDDYFVEKPNKFTNTFVISERFAFGDSDNIGDADNWTHLENEAMGSYNIKRYVKLSDMMHSATYSVAEDWTVTTAESSETEATTIGNYIVAKKYTKASTGVTRLKDGAFEEFVSIKGVALSESLMGLGDNVFNGCKKLKEISIPDNVKSIGDFSFVGYESLTNLEIGDRLK